MEIRIKFKTYQTWERLIIKLDDLQLKAKTPCTTLMTKSVDISGWQVFVLTFANKTDFFLPHCTCHYMKRVLQGKNIKNVNR